MTDKHGKEMHVRSLFANLTPGKQRILRHSREVSREWVWLSGSKLASGELLIVASNHYTPDPIDTYRLRWEIENLFQCLKRRGFHMEATHFTKPPTHQKDDGIARHWLLLCAQSRGVEGENRQTFEG